jgi:hypothetical protein
MMTICSSGPKLLFTCLLILLLSSGLAFATDTTVGCPGGTPGAFTSITAALASLSAVGPNSIAVSGTCTENIVIVDRTDLGIFGNPTATIVPANPNGRVLSIFDSLRVGVSNNITFNGGRGIAITTTPRADFDAITVLNSGSIGITSTDSLVHLSNASITNSARSGISVSGGTFYLDTGVNVSNNGRSGVSAGTAHLVLNGGDGTPGTANIISHNGGVGVAIFNTGEADINGDNEITFNGGPFGLEAIHTSTVLMSDGIINSNTGLGVHCGESSHCEWSGATQINSNTGGGIEITDHSDGYIDGGITISGNTGVGILVDLSSLLNSLGGNTISDNTGDAVVLNTLSVLKFALPDTITATTGNLALNCNNGSLVSGDISPYKPKKCGTQFQVVPIH